MSVAIFLLFSSVVILTSGLRARTTVIVLQSMFLSPEKCNVSRWLLFSRGLDAFINPAADATTDYSLRYGERPVTLKTVD